MAGGALRNKGAWGGLTGDPRGDRVSGAHLVAPLEHVLVPVLDGMIDVQELENPVPPHVVSVALGLLPAQRRALGQQPHGRPLLLLLGAEGSRTLRARGASWTLSSSPESAAAAPRQGCALGPQSVVGGSRPALRRGVFSAQVTDPGVRRTSRAQKQRTGGQAGQLPVRQLRPSPAPAPAPLLLWEAATDPTASVPQRLPLPFAGVVHCLLPTCDQNLRRGGACSVPSARSPFQTVIRRSRSYKLRGRAAGRREAGDREKGAVRESRRG